MTAVEDPLALPSPQEVAAVWERMRETVLTAYRRQEEDIAQARQIIAEAEAEQARLRDQYPVFFPERPEPRRSGGGTPTVEQMNTMLRTLAEHPDQTLKQLQRRLNFSDSWTARIIKEIEVRGPYVERSRHGRSFIYRLTADGTHVLNRGGIRAD
jgi:predicted transcriptional regulator